jgi:hypothetical protein
MLGAAGIALLLPDVLANTERSRVVAACPTGHVAGASASAMARRSSKVAPQARHRYS